MAPVRVTGAFRLPIIAITTALALSGCIHTTGPAAVAQPQSDLDSLAYGRPYSAATPGAASSPSDAADKLWVVVSGQDGLTNTYAIDAGGTITMPLIGPVPARGRTPAGLASEISVKLRNGYIREP